MVRRSLSSLVSLIGSVIESNFSLSLLAKWSLLLRRLDKFFPNVKKRCSSNDNLNQPELT